MTKPFASLGRWLMILLWIVGLSLPAWSSHGIIAQSQPEATDVSLLLLHKQFNSQDSHPALLPTGHAPRVEQSHRQDDPPEPVAYQLVQEWSMQLVHALLLGLGFCIPLLYFLLLGRRQFAQLTHADLHPKHLQYRFLDTAA